MINGAAPPACIPNLAYALRVTPQHYADLTARDRDTRIHAAHYIITATASPSESIRASVLEHLKTSQLTAMAAMGGRSRSVADRIARTIAMEFSREHNIDPGRENNTWFRACLWLETMRERKRREAENMLKELERNQNMMGPYTQFVDSLSCVDGTTFARIASGTVQQRCDALLKILDAATTPVETVARSVKTRLTVGPLMEALQYPAQPVSSLAKEVMLAVAHRFGPEFGLSEQKINDDPLRVWKKIEAGRSPDVKPVGEDVTSQFLKANPRPRRRASPTAAMRA